MAGVRPTVKPKKSWRQMVAKGCQTQQLNNQDA